MSYFLPRIVGSSVAADWMLTGRTVVRRRGVPAGAGQRAGRRRPAARTGARARGADRRPLAARRPDDQARAPGRTPTRPTCPPRSRWRTATRSSRTPPRRPPRRASGGRSDDGATRRHPHRDDGRTRARAVLRDVARRPRRRRGARRSSDRGRPAAADRHAHASEPTVDRRRHEAPAWAGDRLRARPRMPTRSSTCTGPVRPNASGSGPTTCSTATPRSRVRAHDGLGPGRSVRPDGRARHQLPRARGCPARGRHRGDAGAAAQPRRRLRRRRHAARGRAPQRHPRAPPARASARSSTSRCSTAPPC